MAGNTWNPINGNTYGTWLRGDARGWRARQNREHYEGDDKKPLNAPARAEPASPFRSTPFPVSRCCV